MQGSELVRVSGSSLLSAIRKARKEFKAVASSQEAGSYPEVIDEIIELSMDDVAVEDWPADTVTRLLNVAPALLSNAISVARSESKGGLSLPALEALTDLVCNIGVAAGPLLNSIMRKEVCQLWIVSRLANGMALHEVPAFNKVAGSTLACFELSEEELSACVRDQVLKQLSLGSGVATPPSIPETPDQDASVSDPSSEAVERPKIAQGLIPQILEEPTSADSSNASMIAKSTRATPPISQRDAESASPDNGQMSAVDIEPAQHRFAEPNPIRAENGYDAETDDEGNDEIDLPSPPAQVSAKSAEALPAVANIEVREPPKTIRNWQRPFGTEKDVNTGLAQFIERLLRSALIVEAQVQLPISQINQAKRQYEEWLGSNQNASTTNFLAKILQAGEMISEKLLGVEQPHEAFRVANVCAEIAKMLVPRNREKYGAALEGLMFLAFQGEAARILDIEAGGMEAALNRCWI